MKLYTVTAEITYVIAVEGDTDPWFIAEDAWSEVKYETDESQIDFTVGREIKSVEDLPSDWDIMCIPFGDGDGNTRIGDMISEGVINA